MKSYNLLDPDVDYLHRNGDDITELGTGYRVRETRTTTNYPGATRKVQGIFVVSTNAPALTEALRGRFFERQQHSSDHN
jgi:hypothetical protein